MIESKEVLSIIDEELEDLIIRNPPRKLSEVIPSDLEWLWEPYILKGEVSLVQGVQGHGKTVFLMTIAACVTRGWGYHNGFEHEPGSVLYLSSEENWQLLCKNFTGNHDLVTFVPLIEVMNCEAVTRRHLDLWEDQSLFRAYCSSVDRLRLVMIDPMTDYLGNSNRKEDVNKFYTVLEDEIRAFGCGALLSIHLNKDPSKGAAHRYLGAAQVTGRCSVHLQISSDQEDKKLKHVTPIKTRYSDPEGMAFNFRVGSNREAIWDISSPLQEDADEGLRKRDPGEGTIRKWLVGELHEGPVRLWDLQNKWREDGYSDNSVRQSRIRLGVVSYRDPPGSKKVWWKLP